MHVVDATLFYSPTSGGVKRYLLAKHEWMRAHTNWRHSLVVPGEQHHACTRRCLHGRGPAGARRVQLPPAAESAALVARHRRARTGPHRSRRRISSGLGGRQRRASSRHSADRLLSLELSRARGRGARQRGAEVHRVVRAAHLRTLRAGARAEPLHVRIPAQHRRDAHHLPAAGRRRRDTFTPRGAAAICAPSSGCRADTRLLVFAGRFSAEKNIPVLLEAFRVAGRALSPAAHRRRRWRPQRQCHAPAVLPRQSAPWPVTSPPRMRSCTPARTKPSAW